MLIPIINPTRRFIETYRSLNLGYLNLLHERQAEAIKIGLDGLIMKNLILYKQTNTLV